MTSLVRVQPIPVSRRHVCHYLFDYCTHNACLSTRSTYLHTITHNNSFNKIGAPRRAKTTFCWREHTSACLILVHTNQALVACHCAPSYHAEKRHTRVDTHTLRRSLFASQNRFLGSACCPGDRKQPSAYIRPAFSLPLTHTQRNIHYFVAVVEKLWKLRD